MRLTISIDSIGHEIDTTDPELLGRWIVEIFGRIREPGAATFITMRVAPSWLPVERQGRTDYVADWSADSMIIGRVTQVRSPRELVAALGRQLDDADALRSEHDQPAR